MKSILASCLIFLSATLLIGAADGSWLRRVPAADHARTNPLSDPTASTKAGALLYSNECAKCHGDHAQGKGSRPTLVSERIATATDGDLAWLLKNGNSWKGMPSWSSMPDAQRWQLVAFLRSLNTPIVPALPQQGAKQ
jgi:mono/diheme cytochrome c family protein